MITVVLVTLMAIALAALVALPLAVPGQADPLPDDRDPVLQDLEEERDALFGAIRELDLRSDLSEDRRAELRARYEAKAAKVLRALDERREELSDRPVPRARPTSRRAPWGLLGLLLIGAGTAATLGGYVLPRVGQDATVTTFFEDELTAAERVRDLRRAAANDPSAANYVALGDAYWQLEDAEGSEEAYQQAIRADDEAPARAYARLGLLALSDDLERATDLLREARARDPTDPTTLGTLGELRFAAGAYAEAEEIFEELVATPEAADDETARARLALVREVVPLAAAAEEDPRPGTLLPLAETLWAGDARDRAAEAYFRILTEFDPQHPTSLARVGELLFLSGRNDDALALLSRARLVAAEEGLPLPPNALLFLGNAAFTAEDWELAIDAWEDHLAVSENPGRVPDLIERARARSRGEEPKDAPADAPAGDLPLPGTPAAADGPDDTDAAAGPVAEAGASLYAEHCAVCHGPQGGGGAGPRLAGNRNAGRPANVESLIRNGRGMMPGFGTQLSSEEVATLRDWVVERFAP